ncbi:hypothetical protein [Paenibacillus sp. PL2-23]|uniref:hypothetical protein n=1 Tax=Paenibacillus sp. PL2-23 TaxID=2100729 RepID=UPI0030FBCC91
MGFVTAFVAAWLAAFIFYGMNKRLSVVENTFVFLVAMIIGIHLTWFVVEELQWIESTDEGFLYAGALLYRSVIFPLVTVILMNVVCRLGAVSRQLLAGAISLLALLALNAAFLFYDIQRYVKWSLLYEALAIVLMQLLVYVLLRFYRRASERRWSA